LPIFGSIAYNYGVPISIAIGGYVMSDNNQLNGSVAPKRKKSILPLLLVIAVLLLGGILFLNGAVRFVDIKRTMDQSLVEIDATYACFDHCRTPDNSSLELEVCIRVCGARTWFPLTMTAQPKGK
jgi:hypothetical protein